MVFQGDGCEWISNVFQSRGRKRGLRADFVKAYAPSGPNPAPKFRAVSSCRNPVLPKTESRFRHLRTCDEPAPAVGHKNRTDHGVGWALAQSVIRGL